MYIQIVSFFLNEYIGEIEWIEDQIIVINGKNQFQKRYYSQTSKKIIESASGYHKFLTVSYNHLKF